MLDETTETTQPVAGDAAATTDQGDSTPESGQPPIHPLAEGGVRFNEVYGEMKAAKARTEMLERQVAELTAAQQRQTQAQAPQPFTDAQLQAQVDAGRMTPMQAADRLAWQRAEDARVRGHQEWEQRQLLQDAQGEIDRYLVAKPDALGDPRVLTVARQIQRETGWAPTDPRLARRSLREVYGTPERVESAQRQQEQSRQAGATGGPVEGRAAGGLGSGTSTTQDPLKGAPQYLVEFWDQMGYSPAQRLKEFKVYKPPRGFALRQGREPR